MTAGPFDSAQRLAFRTFGVLPKPIRRFIIRTIRPSWTAGSLAVIERADGRWLFVRPVYRKHWTLPGGLVDKGEFPDVTVVREMKEELGIDVELTTAGWVILDPEMHRVESVYRARLADGVDPDGIEITTPELVGFGWFDPATPPDMEEETHDVFALLAQVEAGGSTVFTRPARGS